MTNCHIWDIMTKLIYIARNLSSYSKSLSWLYTNLFNSSITAITVQGTKASMFKHSLPMLSMWNPSTSFEGWTALHTFLSEMCLGTGNCTKIPWTVGSSLRAWIFATNSFSLIVSGKWILLLLIPIKNMYAFHTAIVSFNCNNSIKMFNHAIISHFYCASDWWFHTVSSYHKMCWLPTDSAASIFFWM